MSKVRLALLLLVLLTTVIGQAQIQFEVSSPEDSEDNIVYRNLSRDNKTVVEFLYLTLKDEFCTLDVIGDFSSAEVFLCIFEDPTTQGVKHLYVSNTYRFLFVVFHNGEIATVFGGDQGISTLQDGDYEVLVFSTNTERDLVSTVTFTVGEYTDSDST